MNTVAPRRKVSNISEKFGNVSSGGYSKSGLPLIKKGDYEILYGLILGDAYISRKKTENASLRFEQSIIHKEYLKHLFDKFSYLGTKNVAIKVAERKLFNSLLFILLLVN